MTYRIFKTYLLPHLTKTFCLYFTIFEVFEFGNGIECGIGGEGSHVSTSQLLVGRDMGPFPTDTVLYSTPDLS